MKEVSAADTVSFAVKGSKSFHRLELSKSLIRFAEFDFTSAAKNAKLELVSTKTIVFGNPKTIKESSGKAK